ncbi:MAG: hypothetical protein JSR99_14470 [Proteobacteria bacterium]|nr:hypothetical protein [Pseudomonadota bacterium]
MGRDEAIALPFSRNANLSGEIGRENEVHRGLGGISNPCHRKFVKSIRKFGGTGFQQARFSEMTRKTDPMLYLPLRDATGAVLAGAVFALALLWMNVLDLGELVAQPTEYFSSIIFVIGGAASLGPAFLAIAFACGYETAGPPA